MRAIVLCGVYMLFRACFFSPSTASSWNADGPGTSLVKRLSEIEGPSDQKKIDL